jgi:hypothetical protein
MLDDQRSSTADWSAPTDSILLVAALIASIRNPG